MSDREKTRKSGKAQTNRFLEDISRVNHHAVLILGKLHLSRLPSKTKLFEPEALFHGSIGVGSSLFGRYHKINKAKLSCVRNSFIYENIYRVRHNVE